MGYIKEPEGVDFFVDPRPLTAADRKKISEIIAYYKATGRRMPMQKTRARHSRKVLNAGRRRQS
jgi:hypothetical protein